MHAQHLQATHSAPVVLVGLADARSECPRCCRLPRPKGVWTLPFEIARLRPKRPSLIKPRPALPFSWARWTRRERDCSALFRCRTQPCPQLCPCQRDSASRNDINGKPKKTRQFAILILFHFQNTAQQVEVAPCARAHQTWVIRGADYCWLCSSSRDGCA